MQKMSAVNCTCLPSAVVLNLGWGFSRMRCWGIYLGLRGWKNCIKSFKGFTHHYTSLGWSNLEGWDGRIILYEQGKEEIYTVRELNGKKPLARPKNKCKVLHSIFNIIHSPCSRLTIQCLIRLTAHVTISNSCYLIFPLHGTTSICRIQGGHLHGIQLQ